MEGTKNYVLFCVSTYKACLGGRHKMAVATVLSVLVFNVSKWR